MIKQTSLIAIISFLFCPLGACNQDDRLPQQGLPGQEGPAGPPGEDGEQGQPGPAGADGSQVLVSAPPADPQIKNVNFDESFEVASWCDPPSGEAVIFPTGTCRAYVGNPMNEVAVMWSYVGRVEANEITGWECRGVVPTGSSATEPVAVYAEAQCLTVTIE